MSSACKVALLKPQNEIGDKRMIGMMQNGSENRGVVGSPNLRIPRIEIVEQPASKALRFRYECEGRSAGSIPGVRSTAENRTYPTVKIVGYTGSHDIVMIVSCVTKDAPYRAHPHNLVGRECKDGICSIYVDKETMTATFSNLGIQCVKKKDIEAALRLREQKKVDPFKQGFDHSAHPSSIDLNSVRLCFQAIVKTENAHLLAPAVVSEPIYDKKAMSDLLITRLSHTSAPVKGGTEVLLLCEKVAKEDIRIRFYEETDGQQIWDSFGEIVLVHKQVAIAFKTPAYRTLEVDRTVEAFIQLYRPSDRATSDPLPFRFTSIEPGGPRRKTPKLYEELRKLEQINAQNQPMLENNLQAAQFLIKSEPCPSPDFSNAHSPARTISPCQDGQGPSTSNFTMAPPTVYQPYPVSSQSLPPFGDFTRPSGSGMVFGNRNLYSGGSATPIDYPLTLGPQLASLQTEALEANQNSVYVSVETNQNNLPQCNYAMSLEEGIDTSELLNTSAQNIIPDLAENLSLTLSQSLNISEDLTRLTNEVFEQNFNRN